MEEKRAHDLKQLQRMKGAHTLLKDIVADETFEGTELDQTPSLPSTVAGDNDKALLDKLHVRLRRRIVADTAGYKSDLPKEALYDSGGGGGEYTGHNQLASVSALETSRVSVRTKFLAKTAAHDVGEGQSFDGQAVGGWGRRRGGGCGG